MACWSFLLAKRPKQMMEHRELWQEWSGLLAICHAQCSDHRWFYCTLVYLATTSAMAVTQWPWPCSFPASQHPFKARLIYVTEYLWGDATRRQPPCWPQRCSLGMFGGVAHLWRSFNSWLGKSFILTLRLRKVCWICTSWSPMQASMPATGRKLKLWQKRGLVAVGGSSCCWVCCILGGCWCHFLGLDGLGVVLENEL